MTPQCAPWRSSWPSTLQTEAMPKPPHGGHESLCPQFVRARDMVSEAGSVIAGVLLTLFEIGPFNRFLLLVCMKGTVVLEQTDE